MNKRFILLVITAAWHWSVLIDSALAQGTALSFNGVASYVQIGGSPLPAPWTAEFWVNRQDANNFSASLLADGNTALKLEQYDFTRKVGFTQFGVADYLFNYTAPTNTWVHLAFVADTQTRLYVNGVLQDTTNATINLPLGRIGSDPGHGDYVKGTLDEIRVWNVARSQSQIQANMNGPLALPQPNLVAYWTFDEGSGTNTADLSGNNYNGTLINGPAWVISTVPFIPALTTLPASAISTNSATLNGTVNPNGLLTTAQFIWGPTTNYGNFTPAISVSNGTAPMLLQSALSNLTAGAAYHYRILATWTSGAGGYYTGGDSAFVAALQPSNLWVNPFSDKWEVAQNWTAGAPSLTPGDVFIDNAGTKVVTIDATTSLFSNTMTVANLTITSPTNSSTNTLLLMNVNSNGFLHVVSNLTVLPGGALAITNSTLVVDNGTQPITTPNGSEVELDGAVTAYNSVINAADAMYTTLGGGIFGGGGTANLFVNNSTFMPHYLIVGYLYPATATFLNSSLVCGNGLVLAGGGGAIANMVLAGGTCVVTNNYFGPDSPLIVVGEYGTASLSVSNANVQFGATTIASYGTGSLTVQPGTVMTMGKTSLGAFDPSSSGTFAINGGQVSLPELHVGSQGTGAVNMAAGLLSSPVVSLGEGSNAFGSFYLSGGTNLISSALTVGGTNGGSGQVSVVAAGVMSVTNPAQNANLSLINGSLTLNGGAVAADNLSISGSNSSLSVLNGSLTLDGSTTVSNGQLFTIGDGVDSASLSLPSGTHSFANGLHITGGATLLAGCARINGTVINDGTIVDACAGSVTVFTGTVTNDATIVAGSGQAVEFLGPVVNNGVMAGSNGGAFHFYGPLTNSGTISNIASAPGLTWQPWSEVPTHFTTDVPVACALFQNKLFLFGKHDTEERIFYNTYDGTNWSSWAEAPGNGVTDVALASAAYGGILHVFGKGINDLQLYDNTFDGTNWSGWAALPGGAQTFAAASALSYGGYLYLFRVYTSSSNVYSAGSPLYFDRLSPSGWSGWIATPTNLLTDVSPAAVQYEKVLQLFSKGYVGSSFARVYLTPFVGLTWSNTFEVPSGLFTQAPLAAVSHVEQLHVFSVSAADNLIYANSFNGSSWTGWNAVPGGGPTDLAVAACEFRSKMFLFRVDANHHIYYMNPELGPAPPNCAGISVTRQGVNTVLSWDGIGDLQNAPEATGPWTDVLGASSPMLTQATALRRFFRVLRNPALTPGFAQGACVTELPASGNASQSAFVNGDWAGLQNTAATVLPTLPSVPIDDAEEDMFVGHHLYAPHTLFTIGPAEVKSWTINITNLAILSVRADAYTSPQPLYLGIQQGSLPLATGLPVPIDSSRSTVGAVLTNLAAGQYSVLLTNAGNISVSANICIESVAP